MNTNESYVRALRDQVFAQASTDKNWEACRERWMRADSTAWLEAKAARPLTINPQPSTTP